MSIFVTIAEIEEFDSLVHHVFQAEGFHLRKTMRTRMNFRGSTVRFTVQDEGIAQQKAPQDDVIPMNINYSNVQAILQDWHASEFSDIFAQQEINFDEKKELAVAIAMAIGRRSDQIAIDALDVSVVPAGNVILAAGSGFTYAKLRQINAIMNKNGVGRNERFIALSADAEADLLDELKLTSNDFVNQKLVDAGGIDDQKVFNFTFKVIPDMIGEGGLPITGSDRTCFAYAKPALGMGIGIDFRTEINYEAIKTSWLVTGLFKAGAVAIDPKGIVKIGVDESV